MDHYPQMKPDVDTRSKYCADLSVMRKHSLKAGIPFWNFFNVMPYGPHSDPTEGQLRWQTYTSIAYGAKGVLYFCYYTPAGGEFPKGGAIIARDGTPTRHYGEAQRINAELKNLGPTLMKMKSLGVRRITPKSDLAKVLSGTPIINIKRESYDPTNDYLLGLFKHEDGRWGVLINNYRHAFTAWPTVEFFCNSVWITEVDRTTGKEISVKDDSPDMEGIQLSLGAGEGRLFLLPPPKGGI
jgi:hypothetical protein